MLIRCLLRRLFSHAMLVTLDVNEECCRCQLYFCYMLIAIFAIRCRVDAAAPRCLFAFIHAAADAAVAAALIHMPTLHFQRRECMGGCVWDHLDQVAPQGCGNGVDPIQVCECVCVREQCEGYNSRVCSV